MIGQKPGYYADIIRSEKFWETMTLSSPVTKAFKTNPSVYTGTKVGIIINLPCYSTSKSNSFWLVGVHFGTFIYIYIYKDLH